MAKVILKTVERQTTVTRNRVREVITSLLNPDVFSKDVATSPLVKTSGRKSKNR